jgi:hypothetical protein
MTEDSNLAHLSRGTSSVCEELIAPASAYLRQLQCLFAKEAMPSCVDVIKFVEAVVEPFSVLPAEVTPYCE